MRKIAYPAIITCDSENQMYDVEFPSLEGCFTCAPSYQEALVMAKDALSLFLESLIAHQFDAIPQPPEHAVGMVWIAPKHEVTLALWLRWKRQERKLKPEQVAQDVGIGPETYQLLESAESDPTLAAIARLEEVFAQEIFSL